MAGQAVRAGCRCVSAGVPLCGRVSRPTFGFNRRSCLDMRRVRDRRSGGGLFFGTCRFRGRRSNARRADLAALGKTLRTLKTFTACGAWGAAVIPAFARAVAETFALRAFGPVVFRGARRVRGRGFAALQLSEARGRNVGGSEAFFQQPFDQLVLPLELAAL